MTLPFYVVVEGDGDRRAVPNLLVRFAAELGYHAVWKPPLKLNVLRQSDAQKAGELVRTRQDAEGLLVLRDDEDGCPRTDAPEMARWFRSLDLPFPVACVLFYREYETIFLPHLHELAGKPLTNSGIARAGLRADAVFEGDPEGRRDAKGILTASMPPGRAYKETTDQLAMTQMLDIAAVRAADLPCIGTLERSLEFLLGGSGQPGDVFPLDR